MKKLIAFAFAMFAGLALLGSGGSLASAAMGTLNAGASQSEAAKAAGVTRVWYRPGYYGGYRRGYYGYRRSYYGGYRRGYYGYRRGYYGYRRGYYGGYRRGWGSYRGRPVFIINRTYVYGPYWRDRYWYRPAYAPYYGYGYPGYCQAGGLPFIGGFFPFLSF